MTRSILDAIGETPLVPLERIGRGLPRAILAKCEHLNPGGSVKDRIARAIVDDAEARGLVRPGGALIEATAGNTGVGLALVAAVRGYRLTCVMPEKMAEEKRRALRALGAELVITENAPPKDPRNFQRVAERLAAETGAYLTDQFRNPANARAHYETTAPEIWEQTGGAIGAFVAGAGTGGTLTGVGRFLKERRPSVKILLADPIGSRLADLVEQTPPGPDGTLDDRRDGSPFGRKEASYLVEGIGASEAPAVLDLSLLDGAHRISDRESFDTAWRLVREEGLLVGGSAGTAVAAALRAARDETLDGPVVVLLPDSWDRYQSKIFDPDWLTRVQ